MAQTLHPAPVALQGVATPVAALSAISSVSQGCCSPPKLPFRTPSRTPPVALILALGRGRGVALPPARDVAGSLDLRNTVALQGVDQLHLRVSRYTLTLSCFPDDAEVARMPLWGLTITLTLLPCLFDSSFSDFRCFFVRVPFFSKFGREKNPCSPFRGFVVTKTSKEVDSWGGGGFQASLRI